MKGTRNVGLLIILGLVLILGVWGCSGYNGLVKQDENVKKAWNNVNTEYQKRGDLVDNLVNTVKGAANFEKSTLTELVAARAKATSVNLTADQLTPENIAKFQAAQSQLTSALSRLLAVSENYPQLKADAGFRDLQAQLEGTENRVTVARNRYIKAVKEYNVLVRSFPQNLTAMMFGYKTKPSFTVENEKQISVPPKVDFDTK